MLIALIITVLFVISVRASGGEPTLFGYQFKTVLSGSMEPEIQTGSIIAVQPVEEERRFHKGDIITFKTKEDILVTHRIVEVNGDGKQYITKGDNNDAVDSEPVIADNIVAHYAGFTIPYVGYAAHFASTKQGVALLLILPGIFLLCYSFVIIWRALQQIEVQKEKRLVLNNDQVTTSHSNHPVDGELK